MPIWVYGYQILITHGRHNKFQLFDAQKNKDNQSQKIEILKYYYVHVIFTMQYPIFFKSGFFGEHKAHYNLLKAIITNP